MDESELLSEESAQSIGSTVTAEERKIVTKCLNAVEGRAQSFKQKGLTKASFFFGVANTLFVAWAFGGIPQHFWIVYIIEVAILFPLRWVNQVNARPLKQHFYWLDFCWVANFGAIVVIVLLICDSQQLLSVSDEERKVLFCTAFGIACGPLLLATGLLGNALVFHDADNVASVLIHLFPSMVFFNVMWDRKAVVAAWPSVFHLDYVDDIHLWSELYFYAASGYTIWWVLYTAWLVLHGMTLPSKGFDTIFHANMRGAFGDKIASFTKQPRAEFAVRRKQNDFLVRDAFLYMIGHALGSYVGITAALLCFSNRYVHGSIVFAMVLVTIYNGSKRYTYYLVQMYSDLLRKELALPLHRGASAYIG